MNPHPDPHPHFFYADPQHWARPSIIRVFDVANGFRTPQSPRKSFDSLNYPCLQILTFDYEYFRNFEMLPENNLRYESGTPTVPTPRKEKKIGIENLVILSIYEALPFYPY